MKTNEWYTPKHGDVVWRRHVAVLIPRLFLPFLYALSWIVLCAGSYLSGAMSSYPFRLLLFFGMAVSAIPILFMLDDWQDEMYVISRRANAIIFQKRHPFLYESGRRLPREFISFTVAEMGLEKDGQKPWSLSGFFRWMVGCGKVSVYGPSSRVALEMTDLFLPAKKKAILDKWWRGK